MKSEALLAGTLNDSLQGIVTKLQELMNSFWIYIVMGLAAVIVVWGAYVGIKIAVAHRNEEKINAKDMLKNLIVGIIVIFVIAMGAPLLISGLSAWAGTGEPGGSASLPGTLLMGGTGGFNAARLLAGGLNDSLQGIVTKLNELMDSLWIYVVMALAAAVVVWGAYVGIKIAVAHRNDEKINAKEMVKSLIVGIIIIFVIAMGAPLLINGLSAWAGTPGASAAVCGALTV